MLQKDNKIANLELDKQKLQKKSLIGGLGFVFLLALVLLTLYFMQKKAHAALALAHKQLENAHQEI